MYNTFKRNKRLRARLVDLQIFALASLTLCLSAPIHLQAQSNTLRDASSPYLLQHADDPVQWMQWNAATLEKARQQDKPIFVSVGYSSCFWCHVMAEESFQNEAIAQILNENFISIKIDRETRPDLDERFGLITQTMTGISGWPNSVFLTPDENPILAGGYFVPENLMHIAVKLGQDWSTYGTEVARQAALNAEDIDALTRQSIGTQMLSDVDTASAASAILPALDPFNGGIGVAPKFPRESAFLFLLDEALRNGDLDMLAGVTDLLDGMLLGGVQDHVGGGFHRYAVDPEWHIPHFEKMLYTQALMGRLLIRTWDVTQDTRYRRAAERLFAYVLRDLSAPQGGFYAAQDASSVLADGIRQEGTYYTWTAQDIAGMGEVSDLLREVFQISPEGDLDGRNVLNLSAPLSDLAAAAGVEDRVFVSQVDDALDVLRSHRNPAFEPFLDRKIIVSWNAQMIATLAEASFLFDNPAYYDAAATAATFILETMGGPDALLRISINGTAEEPAQLADLVALGLAAVALHDHATDPEIASFWLEQAQALLRQMTTTFLNDNGTFRMAQGSDIFPLDDGILPSGNAMALDFLTQMERRIEDIQLGIYASGLTTALTPSALEAPFTRSAFVQAVANQLQGDTRRVQYESNGIVRAEIRRDRTDNSVSLHVTLADGWHVNSQQPYQDYLIPTGLQIAGIQPEQILYPEPLTKTLVFSESPLALFEGEFVLHAPLPEVGTGPRDVVFDFQACSNEVCMLPSQLTFVLW